tara:strand:+ start:162 stop:449 length:288 start_codon:yes stop_codon:yes gene_type:complete
VTLPFIAESVVGSQIQKKSSAKQRVFRFVKMINWRLLYLAVGEPHRLLVGFDPPNEVLSFCIASGGREFVALRTSLDHIFVSDENSGNEIFGRSG